LKEQNEASLKAQPKLNQVLELTKVFENMDREKKRQEHDEQERIRRHSTKKARKDTSQHNSR